MRIDILTLFPQMFCPLEESIIKRAREKGIVDINLINIRDFAFDRHQITDDRLYGGGAGMVMKPEPIFAAVRSVLGDDKPRVIITSPQGRPFDQKLAQELSAEEHLIVICGHYEGIDERVIEGLATDIISMGDFVLTGGELPAMAIVDSVTRLLPGALGDELSAAQESFEDGLLEYPHYTRPPIFEGMEVPEELTSGNHAQIAKWRRQKALERTWRYRPDLLESAPLLPEDKIYLEQLDKEIQKPFRIYVALLHYPVYNKKKQVINTSLTNLDLHDIARAAATYDVEGFYIVQPVQNQQRLMQELVDHWQGGFGGRYNPDRKEALSKVRLVDFLEDVREQITSQSNAPLHLIATSANICREVIAYRDMRKQMETQGGDYLLLLGTGWGMTQEILDEAEYCLRPIYGRGSYNHLSVRSAASIMLDRLLGEKNCR